MKREFMHFADFSKGKVQSTAQTPDEFADLVEQQIRKMMEDGEEYGELRIDIPENLTPDEAAMFIEEIIKRFNNEEDDE